MEEEEQRKKMKKQTPRRVSRAVSEKGTGRKKKGKIIRDPGRARMPDMADADAD